MHICPKTKNYLLESCNENRQSIESSNWHAQPLKRAKRCGPLSDASSILCPNSERSGETVRIADAQAHLSLHCSPMRSVPFQVGWLITVFSTLVMNELFIDNKNLNQCFGTFVVELAIFYRFVLISKG